MTCAVVLTTNVVLLARFAFCVVRSIRYKNSGREKSRIAHFQNASLFTDTLYNRAETVGVSIQSPYRTCMCVIYVGLTLVWRARTLNNQESSWSIQELLLSLWVSLKKTSNENYLIGVLPTASRPTGLFKTKNVRKCVCSIITGWLSMTIWDDLNVLERASKFKQIHTPVLPFKTFIHRLQDKKQKSSNTWTCSNRKLL